MARYNFELDSAFAEQILNALRLHEPRLYNQFFPYVREERVRLDHKRQYREQQERERKRREKELNNANQS